jgi:hypothetical protein
MTIYGEAAQHRRLIINFWHIPHCGTVYPVKPGEERAPAQPMVGQNSRQLFSELQARSISSQQFDYIHVEKIVASRS